MRRLRRPWQLLKARRLLARVQSVIGPRRSVPSPLILVAEAGPLASEVADAAMRVPNRRRSARTRKMQTPIFKTRNQHRPHRPADAEAIWPNWPSYTGLDEWLDAPVLKITNCLTTPDMPAFAALLYPPSAGGAREPQSSTNARSDPQAQRTHLTCHLTVNVRSTAIASPLRKTGKKRQAETQFDACRSRSGAPLLATTATFFARPSAPMT